jgi:hypothetical protein
LPKYKGKRSNVTFPRAVYDTIARVAEEETRTVSSMVVVLCEESLKRRGIEIAADEEEQKQN